MEESFERTCEWHAGYNAGVADYRDRLNGLQVALPIVRGTGDAWTRGYSVGWGSLYGKG